MNWEDLRKEAKKIIKNRPTGGFKDVSFACSSGGVPRNKAGVKELRVNKDFAYRTTANGDAYSGEVVVRCRDTGTRDSRKKKIYEDEEGSLFVFYRWPGSPSHFDSGALLPPEFK